MRAPILVFLAMTLVGGCTRKRRPAPPPKVKSISQDITSTSAAPREADPSTDGGQRVESDSTLEPVPVSTSAETLMEIELPRVKGEFGVPDAPSVLVGMEAIGVHVAEPPNEPVELPRGAKISQPLDGHSDAETNLQLVALQEGKYRPGEKPPGTGIPELISALKVLKNFQNRVLALSMSREYGDLSLYVDRNVPFATVSLVLQSMEQAGFRDFYFVVGPPEALTSIKNEVPRLNMREMLPEDVDKLDHWQADLMLRWVDSGVRAIAAPRWGRSGGQVSAVGMLNGGRLQPFAVTAEPKVCPAIGRLPRGNLDKKTASNLGSMMCRVNGGRLNVYMMPAADTSFNEIIQVMLAVHPTRRCWGTSSLARTVMTGPGPTGRAGPTDCSQVLPVRGVPERLRSDAKRLLGLGSP